MALTDSDSRPLERRREARFRAACRCWLESDSMTLFGTTQNISRRGMFLRTLPAIDTGAEVVLKFTLERGVVSALGRVVWINQPVAASGEPNGAPGIGIEIAEVHEGEDLLEAFISRASIVPEPE